MIDAARLQASRILIVDDQEINVRLLERLLKAEGYTALLGVSDSTVATDLARSYLPDLILLDLHMPVRDGFEVLEELKALGGDDCPPVLVLTADISREARLRALAAGARDFLTKPFDPLEVATRIRNMLEVHHLYRALQEQNAVLEETVRERTEELRRTRMEIIQRLSRAAEFRDQGTGLHILRMSQFSGCLAQHAGFAAEQVDLVLSASPMHDIGKIGIPDSILLKEGRLDAEEWTVMRTHTTLGYDLLSGHDSVLMRTAADIALTHHERWDGTGYPRGLAGEAIPLEGRIVALCDVYDALVSKRPYKEKWAEDDAVEEIRSLAGTHFDPKLVEAFQDALPEIRALAARIDAKLPSVTRGSGAPES